MIIALIIMWIPAIGAFIALILSIIGLVISVRKKKVNAKYGTAGVAVNAIALVLIILIVIAGILYVWVMS